MSRVTCDLTMSLDGFHVAPIVLGAGERLLDGIKNLTLEPPEVSGTRLVTHVRYRVVR